MLNASRFLPRLIRLSGVFLISLLAACGGGGNEPPSVLSTGDEVRAAYNVAPKLLTEYFYGSRGAASRHPTIEMKYVGEGETRHLEVFYRENLIYNKAAWPPVVPMYGSTFPETDIVVLFEYPSSMAFSWKTVVFINGERVSQLESFQVNFWAYGYQPAPLTDIRESSSGWLLVRAQLAGRGGYFVERWAMYHPRTKEFFDCGEAGSNREPTTWGPSESSACVQK